MWAKPFLGCSPVSMFKVTYFVNKENVLNVLFLSANIALAKSSNNDAPVSSLTSKWTDYFTGTTESATRRLVERCH